MQLVHFSSLSAFDNVVHFVTTREGGLSEGAYASFNLSINCGDKLKNVIEHRRRLAEHLDIPPHHLLFSLQSHSDKVLVVDETLITLDETSRHTFFQGVDAMVTNMQGICLCVLTADCVPILLYAPHTRVVAAVHAGWRGTLAKTVVNTVKAMTTVYGCRADEIVACIGPAIGEEIYEVGDHVIAQFEEQAFDVKRFSSINEQTGKTHLNLWKANRLLLKECGIREENIEVTKLCTYQNPELFFSARRQGTEAGRQATGIMLTSSENLAHEEHDPCI